MNLIEEAKQGNRVLRLEFPDGIRIPFRLLTWEQYTVYWELLLKGHVVPAVLEQQIFQECVLEYDYIENIDDLRAGVVASVVTAIMQLSGPANVEMFNPTLEMCRQQVDTLNSQIIMVICRAFPAYKPEDIEQMPWGKVLVRLAQAERILMSKNPPELLEPIKILSPEETKNQKKPGQVRPEDLVQEGRDLAKEETKRPGGLSMDLTPEQIIQLEQLAKRRMKQG